MDQNESFENALKEAYIAGFMRSREGFNGEWQQEELDHGEGPPEGTEGGPSGYVISLAEEYAGKKLLGKE